MVLTSGLTYESLSGLWVHVGTLGITGDLRVQVENTGYCWAYLAPGVEIWVPVDTSGTWWCLLSGSLGPGGAF